ncbi:hypothetical protein BY458DRAFT_529400 [Sporodiniella umbellata]|nr:hypothetical protein BY458DRAFT_529400 [Sporodiniella umbellata]
MPFQTTTTTLEPQLDTVTHSEPIDCPYPHHGTEQQDGCSSLSTSSSSSSSSSSSCSNQCHSDFDMFLFDENTTTLSDLLCDHYVQSKTSDTEMTDVPLETFRIFQAPSVEHNRWLIEQEKEWTLVEASEKYAVKQEPKDQDSTRSTRAIRTNSDYFRIIVAEVNMMRAQKIVGPLRQRRLMDKRPDPFLPSTPSPLSKPL